MGRKTKRSRMETVAMWWQALTPLASMLVIMVAILDFILQAESSEIPQFRFGAFALFFMLIAFVGSVLLARKYGVLLTGCVHF